MNRLLCLLAALVVLFTLAACGQSGPLYIPGNPSTVQAPAEAPPAQDEDDESEETTP